MKTAALPAFHAVTGADVTGSMSGKGKVTCWKVFEEADKSVVETLVNLGVDNMPSEEVMIGIEKLPVVPTKNICRNSTRIEIVVKCV